MSSGLHVVLGASGGIGGAVLDALTRRGLPARAVSRSAARSQAEGLEVVCADLTDPRAAEAAVFAADVVYHCAMPPYTQWPQQFPALTQTIAHAARKVGAVLVVADNLYAAARTGRPLTEEGPLDVTGTKAAVRSTMADELMGAHRRGDLRVTFGRAADYYGPGPRGLHSIPGHALFTPALRGRTPRWPGRTDLPHALHHLPDIGEALVTLGCDQRAWGRAWNLPSAAPLTADGYCQAFTAALGRRRSVARVPGPLLRAAGLLDAEAREAAELLWQFDRPFLIDDSQYRSHFDLPEPRPHPETLASTARWWSDRPETSL